MLILICISTAGMVSASYFLKILIDDFLTPLLTAGVQNPDFTPLFKLMGLMALIFGISALATYSYARIMLKLSQSTVKMIRHDLFEVTQSLPISYFDTHTHGEIMSRFTNDVDTVRNFLSSSFVQTISSALAILTTTIMMLVLSVRLTLVMAIGVACMLLIIKVIGKRSSFFYRKQQEALGNANGFIEEMIEGQKVIKVFNHEAESRKDFKKLNQKLQYAATNAATYSNILWPIVGNFSHVVYTFLAISGGLFVLGNFITVGTVASFLQYTRSFTDPLVNLTQQFNNILSALAGAERIFDLLDQKAECDDGYVSLVNVHVKADGSLQECKEHTGHWAWKHVHTEDKSVSYIALQGDVEFSHVHFSYDHKKEVLHDISLYAKPGQKIALVGSTGAGKTTITNLLNRFYELEDGKIRYDGINIQKMKKSDLRSSLSTVLQDTHLFTGTVAENIRYGNLDATREDIIAAAKLANADEFIQHLPDGYDTVLTGDGTNLSQGQRQLLAIARAAVADPPVLVLDEATSSIDTRTESLIEKGMDSLMQGRTVFVIAHRLSTVRNADAILVLENGEIIERGTHDELLQQKGRYYQLYTGQFVLT